MWMPLVLVSMLTWFVYLRLWNLSSYRLLLATLAALSIVFSLVILVRTKARAWSIVGVCGGLIVGQWWLVELVVAQLVWNRQTFAP